MKKYFVLLLFLLWLPILVLGQNEPGNQGTMDPRELFISAQSNFLYEDYAEALPEYMRLSKLYPENDHLRFKIGICLLNDPFQKDKAISFLEKAVKNTARDFKDNNLKENRAPIDAWFYLGNAYRVNNMLDKALDTYEHFKQILDPAVYDVDLVEEQITSVKNAMRLIKAPMDVDFRNMGEPVNTRYTEQNAVLSADENSMLFLRQTAFQPIVFYAQKKNNQWQEPRNIMFEVGSDGDLFPTSISADGKEAFFYSNDNMLGTILTSKLVNGQWTKAKPLNDKINTKYWESHACISADGLTLYFTSNRKGGLGGLDIYKATRTPGGDWTNVENLGPNVNTRYNEETPFITQDGKTLYFSSYGHFNMGGYDIFYSNLLDDGTWSKPLNAGYPINTTSDDLFFVPLQNGNVAYISRYDEKTTLGRMDIYRFDIYSGMHPRKYSIKGIVRLEGLVNPGSNPVRLSIFDRIHTDTLQVLNINKESGDYALDLPAGEYDILLSSEGFKPRIEKLVIPKNYKNGDITLNSRLQAEEKKSNQVETKNKTTVSQLEIVGKKSLEVTSGEPIRIKLNLVNGSVLQVSAWVDSVLGKTERLQAAKNKITYIYAPKPGLNLLVFRLTGLDKVVRVDTMQIIFDDTEIRKANAKPDAFSTITDAENLDGLLEMMRHASDGNLRRALDQLDLSKENIKTGDELISFLLKNADQYGYSSDDVFHMLSALSAGMSLQEFLNRLLVLSEGNLNKMLQAINPATDSIADPYQLVDYLFNKAGNSGYSAADVRHLLGKAASLDAPEPVLFLEKMKVFSDEEIQQLLNNAKAQLSGARDNLQMIDLLYAQALRNGIGEDKITRLLVTMASTLSMEEYIRKLIPFADGILKGFLSTLDPAKEGIYTPDQLIRYLLLKADSKGYTKQDVINMLLASVRSTQENVGGFKKLLAGLSDGNLQKAINETDLRKDAITNSEQLVNKLLNESQEKKFTHSELIHALTAMAFDGDPADHLIRISRLTSGDTAKALLRINPEAEGIHTMPALYTFLLDQSSKTGLGKQRLDSLLFDYLAKRNIEIYLRKLIPLASGSLKSTLENVNLYTYRINTIPELVDYLMINAPVQGYTEKELLQLLMRMDERIKLDEMIARAGFHSHDSLLSKIRMPDIEKDFIYSRDAWNGYLLQQSDSSTEAYRLLFENLGANFSPQVLRDRMILLSPYKMKTSLGKLSLVNRDGDNAGLLILDDLIKNGFADRDIFPFFKQAVYSLEAGEFTGELDILAPDSLHPFFRNLALHKDTLRSRSQVLYELILSVNGNSERTSEAASLLARDQELQLMKQFMRDAGSMPGGDANAWLAAERKLTPGISNFSDLFRTLSHESASLNLDPDHYMTYLLQVLDRKELEQFIEGLSGLATGELKQVIDGIDLRSGKYITAGDIVQFLLEQAASHHYTEMDVIRLLVNLANKLLKESLANFQYRSDILGHKNILPVYVTGGLVLTGLLLLLFFVIWKRRKKKD